MGLGFTLGLTCIGIVRESDVVREIIGFSIADIYEPVTIFILAPGAFLVLAFLVAARNKIMKKLEAKGKKVVKAQGCCEGGCASCGGCDGHVFPTGQEKE